MDSNELTLGQLKELSAMTIGQPKSSGLDYPIGSYVIVRSRNEGVNAGFLVQADETGCVLKDARRLWRLISKDRDLIWYEGVSQSGLGDESQVSGEVAQKIIVEDYSITLCTDEAEKSIREFKTNETRV